MSLSAAFHKVLIYWDFHPHPSPWFYRERSETKKKMPRERLPWWQECLVTGDWPDWHSLHTCKKQDVCVSVVCTVKIADWLSAPEWNRSSVPDNSDWTRWSHRQFNYLLEVTVFGIVVNITIPHIHFLSVVFRFLKKFLLCARIFEKHKMPKNEVNNRL